MKFARVISSECLRLTFSSDRINIVEFLKSLRCYSHLCPKPLRPKLIFGLARSKSNQWYFAFFFFSRSFIVIQLSSLIAIEGLARQSDWIEISLCAAQNKAAFIGYRVRDFLRFSATSENKTNDCYQWVRHRRCCMLCELQTRTDEN